MIAIGIDIGGTSIKGSAVDRNGKVYTKFYIPITPGESQETTIKKLIKATKEYIGTLSLDEDISGIGLGIPGSIDSTNGVVTYSNNLKWENLKIVEMFKKEFTCPIKITNDANAAALGEAVFGAGKEYKDMVMITLGTGVGSGIVINGQIFEGKEGKGAEIGHSVIVLDGEECTCGRRGCFEAYASATALVRQTRKAMDEDKTSLMWKLSEEEGTVNGKVSFEAMKLGDKKATEVVEQYVKYLGEGLLNVCNIFRPDCIVLSGGIANQGEVLTSRLIKYCKDRQYGYPLSPVTDIRVAELGYESGIIGAACLILGK